MLLLKIALVILDHWLKYQQSCPDDSGGFSSFDV